MVIRMMHNFIYCSRLNKLPQQFISTKWSFKSFILQGRQFHSSPSIQSDITKYDRLVDQGRRSILKQKTRDKVPNDYHLIYKAPMELTMRVSYPTFMFCVVGLFGLVIYKRFSKENFEEPKSINTNVKFLYPEYETWFFAGALLLITLAGLSVMFKFPFRIYKHSSKKEYIAIYLNPVPPMLKQVEFTSAYPTKFKNPLYFFMNECHYVLDGKKKSFLMSHLFRIPKDLTDMFDEPRNVS